MCPWGGGGGWIRSEPSDPPADGLECTNIPQQLAQASAALSDFGDLFSHSRLSRFCFSVPGAKWSVTPALHQQGRGGLISASDAVPWSISHPKCCSGGVHGPLAAEGFVFSV